MTISSKNSIFSSVFFAWISSWWNLHNAIKSDPSDLFVLFQRMHLEMWWISVAIFGQSGISQWMMSLVVLCLDFNRSRWCLSIFLIFFDKIKRIYNHIFLKCFYQFFCVYMIRISQTSPQWFHEWSSIIFKWFTKFGSIKRNRFHQFRFFIFFHQ